MRRKSATVRLKILDAARELFLQNGYASTSVERISDQAGVSKATVYSHFEGKEDLFREMVKAFTQGILDLFPEPRPVEDIRTELVDLAQRIYSRMLTAQKASWDRMIIATTERFPRLAAFYFETGPAQVLAQMASFLEQNRGQLKIEQADFSAELFLGMILGIKPYYVLLFSTAPTVRPGETERLVDAFLEIHRP